MKEPAVALKVALLALAAIDTVAGTVIVPVEVTATVVADPTGPLIVTVQADKAPGASAKGVQARPLSKELGTATVTVPPLVFRTSALPSRLAPRPLETPMTAPGAPAASVNDTLATLPLEMRLVLIPLARQI